MAALSSLRLSVSAFIFLVMFAGIESSLMPTTQGILETALYVADVQIAAAFYRRVFGVPTLLESDRLIALDVAWRNVLLLFKGGGVTAAPFTTPGGVIPGHSGSGNSHFAFAIAVNDVEAWKQHLRDCGAPLESTVTWPGGAVSLYFRDPDNHLAELITPGFWKFGR
jgi:catechol 2,3-dioxygenase-like lactoylglutathione lyase family enzyme